MSGVNGMAGAGSQVGRATTVEKLAMDQEGDDIDEPIKQHVERNERVIVKLLNLKIICCYLECSVCVSHGTRKVKDNFKQQEYDLSLDAYIFLFLLFDPLDLCNFFQDDGQHAQP